MKQKYIGWVFPLCLALLFSACSARDAGASSSESAPASSSSSQAAQAASSAPETVSAAPETASSDAAQASSAPETAAEPAALPEISLSSNSIDLGEALVLHVAPADGLTVTAQTDLPFQPTFYPDGDGMTALLPISYNLSPGNYALSIQAGETVSHYTINVTDREFEIQNLTMSEETDATTNTAEANLEWEQKIEPLKLISDPERYWEGPFMQPVQGTITTEFGCIRYTNDDPVPTRHSGIDIAAATGTPAAAANNGRILFAGFLQLTGNTVVIEHGFGLKSFYYHLDSVSVAEGDMVSTGDEVGKVGSTGYSTGPHLHYSLLVNNVFINPWTAFEQGF